MLPQLSLCLLSHLFLQKQYNSAISEEGMNNKAQLLIFRSPVLIEPLTLLALPEEILLEIIKFIPWEDVVRNVSCVSRIFHKLTNDPHLFRGSRFQLFFI